MPTSREKQCQVEERLRLKKNILFDTETFFTWWVKKSS